MSPAARTMRFGQCVLAGTVLALTVLSGPLAAQSPLNIVKVEEDWELVVLTPDAPSNAPQVTCILSPVGDAGGVYAAVEINHRTLPSFTPGGVQLQIWQGESPLPERRSVAAGPLATAGERITWTQSMELAGGSLTFAIRDGRSQTWGNFGGGESLAIGLPSSASNLNTYQPEASVTASGVGYAENRVESLILKRIRLTTSGGQVFQLDVNRSCYPK